jgi:hypothetical protein
MSMTIVFASLTLELALAGLLDPVLDGGWLVGAAGALVQAGSVKLRATVTPATTMRRLNQGIGTLTSFSRRPVSSAPSNLSARTTAVARSPSPPL